VISKSEIGRRNQANGHKFEIKVWNKVKHKLCLARVISSGSKGFGDVWSLEADKLRIAICKTNGYLDPKERYEIKKFLEVKPKWVRVELWTYKSKRVICKMYFTSDWEQKYEKLYKQIQKNKGE